MLKLKEVVRKLCEEYSNFREETKAKLKRLQGKIVEECYDFMDELGLKMGKEVEFLMLSMTSKQT